MLRFCFVFQIQHFWIRRKKIFMHASIPAVHIDSLMIFLRKKVLISSIVTCETFLCLHRVRVKRKSISSVPGAGDDADKKKRQTRGGKAAGKKKKEVVKRITVSRAPRGKKKFVTVVTGLTSYGESFFSSFTTITFAWLCNDVAHGVCSFLLPPSCLYPKKTSPCVVILRSFALKNEWFQVFVQWFV